MAGIRQNPAISFLVLQAFANHRKRLQALAKSQLPEEVTYELGLMPGHLPDLQAYRTYQFLKASSANAEIFRYGPWSVYDCMWYSLELADYLWESGFRDVGKVDQNNETCLTKLCRMPIFTVDRFSEYASWLIARGAAINHEFSGSPALHFLGQYLRREMGMGLTERSISMEVSQLSECSIDLIRTIFVHNSRDTCRCFCSANGCSGLTRLLQEFAAAFTRHTIFLVPFLASLIESLIAPMNSDSRERLLNQAAPIILRFTAFEFLGIKHTCMHCNLLRFKSLPSMTPNDFSVIHDEDKLLIDRLETQLAVLKSFYLEATHSNMHHDPLRSKSLPSITPDDISEIHDEEGLLIDQLETLLAEFIPLSTEVIHSFPEFLTGQWMTRINEVISSGTPSAEEIDAIRATGVVLYSEDGRSN